MNISSRVISNKVLFQEVRRLVGEGKTVTVKVRGRSMTPFLHDGTDSVVISQCPPDKFKKGMMVLASDTAGKIVLHRIVKVEKDWLVLMGDGNCRGTERVRKDDVAGVVTKVKRDGRTIDCNGYRWQFMSVLWQKALPLRPYLLAARRRWIKMLSGKKQ